MWSKGVAAAVLAACLLATGAAASDEEGCLFCHRHALKVASTAGRTERRVQDPRGAAHQALHCSDCHPDARTAPHPSPPGPAVCIGECHAGEKGAAAAPAHRRAAYGGLTEKHRGVASSSSPCLACHLAADRAGERGMLSARCAGCHPAQGGSAAQGVHGRLAGPGRSGICPDCHRAHQGAASPSAGGRRTAAASCDGKGCHPSVTAAMMRLAGHGGAGKEAPAPAGRALKGAVVLLLAAAGWGAGRALGGPGRDGA